MKFKVFFFLKEVGRNVGVTQGQFVYVSELLILYSETPLFIDQ